MIYIKEFRESTNLSQEKFAKLFHIPVSTLRKWEQNESRPPAYVVRFIKNALPQANEECDVYYGKNGAKFYLNKDHDKAGDILGNWIPFHEDISGVIEDNIGIYLEELFTKYYEAVKAFEEDLKFDKIHHIKWR